MRRLDARRNIGRSPEAMVRFLIAPALVMVGLLASGCLPGHQRTTPRELFPADSLSRQIAAAAPVDTLALVWRTRLPEAIRSPLTLGWVDDRIVVADLQTGALHALSGAGQHVGTFSDPRLEFPLIAGMHGDTVAVLSRGRSEVLFVSFDGDGDARVAGSVPVPQGRNLVAHWSGGHLFVKRADDERGSAVSRIGAEGSVLAEYPLPGPEWRHIGFLRVWGDTLLSLSGYRPVVDVLPKDAAPGARLDTLALMGFDSPQLAHSRSFVLGERREPPLLVPAAAAAGERLFVLNARPGWVHVDVFRRGDGELRLERSLLSPDPGVDRNFFASDVRARRIDGGYEFIVLEARPLRSVVKYRWRE